MAIVMYAIAAAGLVTSIAALVAFSREDRELARQEHEAPRPAR